MDKKLKIGLLFLGMLSIIILFLIPFSIINTNIYELKNDFNNKIHILNHKIDSLENELKIKNDTIIIKPIKIEIYECKQS